MTMRELTTNRLTLRPVKLGDALILHEELGCDPEITKYTGWNPYGTVHEAEEKIREDLRENGKTMFSWIIQRGGDIVGTIGAYDFDQDGSSIEIGCSIFKKKWGQGIASEAVSEVVRYLLEEKQIKRVHAWCHVDNTASAKAMEKAGLQQVDCREDILYYDIHQRR